MRGVPISIFCFLTASCAFLRTSGVTALYILVVAIFCSPYSGAQIGGASERGTDLGLLVDTLAGGGRASSPSELPCLDIWERPPDAAGFACLLTNVGNSFQIEAQWALTKQIFEVRFGERRSWQALLDTINHQSAKFQDSEFQDSDLDLADQESDASPDLSESRLISFAGLRSGDECPVVVNFEPFLPGDFHVQWLVTPEGLRDLSPPRVRPETDDRLLLREGVLHPEAVQILQETPCTDLRLPLTRALVRSALAFGDLARAQQLATMAYMPRRYVRQAIGATQDKSAMTQMVLEAADAVLEGQFNLENPLKIEAEVTVLLNEIDRQFAIDFLIGRLWSLDMDALRILEFDDDFIAEVARLLSQDARLLQQGYGSEEVRFFYSDFFDVLVAKQAFGLLRGLDLLVPAVIRSDFQLALSAQPLTATSPTRFERDQEALALLIRLQEVEAVLGVWPELSSPQRQDAVLYAFDQGAWKTAGLLYAALSKDKVSADFLIRLALYYADAMDVEPGNGLQIDIEVGADA